MFYIEAPRLILVSTPLEVIRKRLEHEAFTAVVPLADGPKAVTFPAEWPGDAIVIFPYLIEQLEANPKQELWEGTLIERATHTAVGQLGCKGPPDKNGSVEIGYGLSPAFQGHGYATEIVSALASWLLEQPAVSKVTAECLETNAASVRVLQKTGFALVGEKASDEGRLLLWVRDA
jgi:[ribosomal protein S5]-alanine N-acetyltransferase